MQNVVHQETFCTGTYHSSKAILLYFMVGMVCSQRPLLILEAVRATHRGAINKLVWPVPLAQVLPRPQLIFPFKTWFFGIYLNFQWQKSLKNQYLAHSGSKSYQINSIKSCSSRSFQQHQSHIPIPPNFQLRFNLIFNDEIIQYSKTFALQVQTSWTQAHAPLLIKSFPKTPRTQSEASRFVDFITTK
jgi:hypothetical protein